MRRINDRLQAVKGCAARHAVDAPVYDPFKNEYALLITLLPVITNTAQHLDDSAIAILWRYES